MSDWIVAVGAALSSGKAVVPGFGTFQRLGDRVEFVPDKDFRAAIANESPLPADLPPELAPFAASRPGLISWSVRIEGLGRFGVTRMVDVIKKTQGFHARITFAPDPALAATQAVLHLDVPEVVRTVEAGLLAGDTFEVPALGSLLWQHGGVSFRPPMAAIREIRAGRRPEGTPDWVGPLVDGLATGRDVVAEGLGTFTWKTGGIVGFDVDEGLRARLDEGRTWRGDRMVLRRTVISIGGPLVVREDVRALLADPRFEAIRSVEIQGAEDGDAVALAPFASQLEELVLVDGGLSDAGAAALAAASWPQLGRLRVSGNRLSADGVALLARVPGLEVGVQLSTLPPADLDRGDQSRLADIVARWAGQLERRAADAKVPPVARAFAEEVLADVRPYVARGEPDLFHDLGRLVVALTAVPAADGLVPNPIAYRRRMAELAKVRA